MSSEGVNSSVDNFFQIYSSWLICFKSMWTFLVMDEEKTELRCQGDTDAISDCKHKQNSLTKNVLWYPNTTLLYTQGNNVIKGESQQLPLTYEIAETEDFVHFPWNKKSLYKKVIRVSSFINILTFISLWAFCSAIFHQKSHRNKCYWPWEKAKSLNCPWFRIWQSQGTSPSGVMNHCGFTGWVIGVKSNEYAVVLLL